MPSADKDIGLLLRQALDRFRPPLDPARRPLSLGIFDGTIQPADYNNAWTKIRLDYQGVKPPVERPAVGFDPGAKYHIPGNVPYTRYFLARVLQFQFYKAACDQAGWTGPLHRCSFYGNKEVGKRLNAMLEMGASKPWPDALEAFTGTRQMSGKAMAEYFAPLKAWLDEQNRASSRAGKERAPREGPPFLLRRAAAISRRSRRSQFLLDRRVDRALRLAPVS